jgi:hypothetical protein
MLFRKPVSAPDQVRGRLFRGHALAPARHTLDFGADHPLDHAGQIFVEPGLEHRPQHFATRSSRVRAFCTSTVCASVLNAESTAAVVSAERSADNGSRAGFADGFSAASSKPTSGLLSMVRNRGAGLGIGAVIDSVSSRMSAGCSSSSTGCSSTSAGSGSSSESPFIIAGGIASSTGCRSGGGTGAGAATVGRGGGAAGTITGAGGLAGSGTCCVDLLASSSAIIRRMEASISSIDGSVDLAGCVMPHPRCLLLERVFSSPRVTRFAFAHLCRAALVPRPLHHATNHTTNYATAPLSCR